MATVNDSISRIRNILKAVKQDPFITDRFIYSLIMKYGKTLMYRDSKAVNIFKNSGLFREISCLELIDTDVVNACCIGIKTACKIKRSKYPLPAMVKMEGGPVVRAVTTLDYSQQLNKTEPQLYVNATKSTGFKYNKIKYYWILDNYLYIPDVEWEAVRIQAMFEEDVSVLNCNDNAVPVNCILEQDREMAIPEHLFTEIENMVRQEFAISIQIPTENADDKQNILR
jgi:hypothetical protein